MTKPSAKRSRTLAAKTKPIAPPVETLAADEDGTPYVFKFVVVLKVNRLSPRLSLGIVSGKVRDAGFPEATVYDSGEDMHVLVARRGVSFGAAVGAAVDGLGTLLSTPDIMGISGVEFGYY